ncbi:hypothetical protein ACWEV3_40080 [Saccharopolyspora sp. NPDC003752]
MIPNSKGGVLHYSNFKRAVSAADLTGVTPHSPRHAYALRAVAVRRADRGSVEASGHASVLTTERYAHLADTQWDAFGEPQGPRPTPFDQDATDELAANAAPRLRPENDTAAGAEIIDLFSRRRSAG